ncbi:MAG: DNRLRE domain-containing protein [Firmicutes bacterium]|nr:DNRLRE domain-containing protein [Bacillota bacterium]
MASFFFGKKWARCKLSVVAILVIGLVFGLIPQPVFNIWGNNISTALAAENITSASQAAAKLEKKEIVEKRTEKTKTYDLGNGKYAMEIYQAPIHYQENGSWKEIDAKIKPSGAGGFENTAGPFKARFGAKGKSSELASFEYSGAKVTQSLAEDEAADATPKVEGEKITYENILPDTDLREIITGIGVKEDIILKKYTGKNSFTFELKTAGVDAQKEVDGSIGFYKKATGEKLFNIPKPFMMDSNVDSGSGESARSDNVTADVIQKGANTYITITADDKWLKAPERVYPVYIDPTIDLNTANNNVWDDAYVTSAYPNNNYDARWNSTLGIYELKTGYIDSSTGWNHSFVKMDVSPLRGKLIHNAVFYAYCRWSYVHSTPKEAYADIANWDWSPTGVTWNNQPSSSYTHWNWATENNWVGFGFTDIAADWVMGRRGNFGFKLHSAGNGAYWWKKFNACETGWGVPHLYVEYYDPPSISSSAYGNAVNSKNGYVNLSWGAVPGAAGYKLWIYNGRNYEAFDVGNTTSWSTQGKRIWPTPSEIAAGRYALHHDGAGAELADDPSPVYRNSGGSYPSNQNFWFRVTAYNWCSETDMWANCTCPYIPDRTAPQNPTNVSVSAAAYSADMAKVNVTWTGVSDPATGSNYGMSHYIVELDKTNLLTGATTTDMKQVAHTSSGAAHTATFNEPYGYSYKVARVRAYDRGGNYSTQVQGTNTDSTAPAVSFTSPTAGAIFSGDSTITVTAVESNSTYANTMQFTTTKNGTDDKIPRAFSFGINPASFDLNSSWLPDGEHIFTVADYDLAGNYSIATVNAVIDNVGYGMGVDHFGMVDNRYGKVNIANGNFVVTEDDIMRTSKGFGLNLSRVYNSQLKVNGPLGWGWRIAVPELAEYSDGTVAIIDGDGAKHRFTKGLNGTYESPAGVYDILTKNPDDTFTLRQKDLTRFTFDRKNRTITVQDRENNKVVYQFDALQRLLSIKDPSNPSNQGIILNYNQNTGKLETAVVAATDYGNLVWRYIYDTSDNLTEVIDPMGRSTKYGYSQDHKLTSLKDPKGAAKGKNTAEFVYEAEKLASVKEYPGNGTTLATTYTYAPSENKFVEKDARGNDTTYTYDGNWNITQVTDAAGLTTTYTYDENFNVKSKKEAKAAKERVFYYSYDAMGNKTAETDPMGHVTRWSFGVNPLIRTEK